MTRWPGAMPAPPIALGVDIIENCEVTGFVIEDGQGARESRRPRGRILAGKVGIAVAGHTSHVADMAGLRLPVESHILQAFVSEPIKPWSHHVVSFGARALLSLAIGQGRARLRRPYRRLQHLYPARPVPEGADRGRMRGRR